MTRSDDRVSRDADIVRVHSRWPTLAAFVAFGVTWGTWGAALPGVQARVGVSDAELGVALLCVAVGAVPAIVLGPHVAARLGRARLAVPLVFLAGGVALVVPAHDLTHLCLAMLLLGIGSGATDVAMNVNAVETSAVSGQSVLQLGHGLFSSGVVVSAVAVGVARQTGIGIPTIVLTLVAVLLTVAVATTAATMTRHERQSSSSSSNETSRGRMIVILGVLAAMAFAIENAFQSWGSIHLERSLDARPSISGLAPALFAGGAAVGRLAAHVRGKSAGRTLVRSGAIGAAVAAVVFGVAPSPIVALVAVALAGLMIGPVFPELVNEAGDIGGAARAHVIARVSAIGYVGFLVGPPVVGALASATSLGASFAVGVAALAVLLAIRSRVR